MLSIAENRLKLPDDIPLSPELFGNPATASLRLRPPDHHGSTLISEDKSYRRSLDNAADVIAIAGALSSPASSRDTGRSGPFVGDRVGLILTVSETSYCLS